MIEAWLVSVPAFIVAALLLTVPGLIVVLVGWGPRHAWLLSFLSPAVSTAIVGVAAVASPMLGLGWSLLPVALVTAVAVVVAFFVGRRNKNAMAADAGRSLRLVAFAAFVVAAGGIAAQFVLAFGHPDNIAQRFDNVAHLNTVQFALQTSNASPFHVGATSDIPFYPSAWHAITALVAQLAGASVPAAVNATNIVIAAVVWTASAMAMVSAIFPGRAAALVAAAALSTGFGAFPALFFNWGVLYPNVLGYAVVPAALAAVALVCRSKLGAELARNVLLVLVTFVACGLAHPNAALAAYVFGALSAIGALAVRALTIRTRTAWLHAGLVGSAILVVFVVVWSLARTGAAHSGWLPWQSEAQAVGEALLLSPRGFTPTVIVVGVTWVGLVAAIVRPSRILVILPFVGATVLFVLASGFRVDHWLRLWLTNPWYSDSNRLAALLPIAAIPVATLGVLTIVDAARRLPLPARWNAPLTRTLAGFAGAAVLFTVGFGTNVRDALGQVREAYMPVDGALLLSPAERALIERLPDEVPEDATIIGSPRTGASLAYALAERNVTEFHIFGDRSADEVFLDANLRNIEADPAVCSAVDRLGIDYVLDFGDWDVFGDEAAAAAYDGVQNLTPSPSLELVDYEGDDARLFRVVGC